MKNNYFKLTDESVAIVQRLDEYGELRASVWQNGKGHPVDVSALKLVEWNLAQAGFSMKGSKESARRLLGTTSMFPVCINYDMLIFFPTESIKNDTCIWVGVHMVRKISEVTTTTSCISCYGHTDFIVPVTSASLKKRWHSALVFQAKLQYTKQPRLILYGEKRQELQVIRDGVRVTYKVK